MDGRLSYRVSWGMVPDEVLNALEALNQSIKDHTDWLGVQITLDKEYGTTIDVQVEDKR